MTAYQPDAALHIVQITPTSYAKTGIIGGGERLVLYLNDALRRAAQELHLSVRTSIVALDGLGERAAKGEIVAISGTAWDPRSIQAEALIQTLKTADYVYVHQCMTEVGLFAAAHARLLGKRVFGSDAGAGEASMLRWAPDILEIYEGLHSISRYAALAFGNTSVPVHVISGPVDSDMYTPGKQPRDMHLAISVGRVMPHKGYERTIRALPPGLSLAIVGQQYDAAYLAFLRECAAGKNVEFFDDLDDEAVRSLLLRAGLFIHASTHLDYLGRFYHKPELLGLAPLEAIASGTTTLVSNAGSLPELGALPGCHVFNTEAELASLLSDFSMGRLSAVDPATMHQSVVDSYGLVATGTALLKMMKVIPS